MKKIILAATAISLIATPAMAKDMHCMVNQNYSAALNNKVINDYRLVVMRTFTGSPDYIGSDDWNGFVNVTWYDNQPTSPNVHVEVRPRNASECLNGIYDESGNVSWQGASCDTSKKIKSQGNFDIRVTDNPSMFASGGVTTTTSKVNHFLMLYTKAGTTYTQIAGCVEDK